MKWQFERKYPHLKITIIPHSASDIIDKSASTKTNALRYIKWRQSAFRFNRNRQTKENKT